MLWGCCRRGRLCPPLLVGNAYSHEFIVLATSESSPPTPDFFLVGKAIFHPDGLTAHQLALTHYRLLQRSDRMPVCALAA